MQFALKESPFLAKQFPVVEGEDEAYRYGIYTVRVDNRQGGTLRELHLPGRTLPAWAREERAHYGVAELIELPGHELTIGSHDLGEQPDKLRVERAEIRRNSVHHPRERFSYEFLIILSMPPHEYLPAHQLMDAIMAARQALLSKTPS